MKRTKKTLSLLLAMLMILSLTACGGGGGGGGGSAKDPNKLTAWALADDMLKFGKKYQEETGIEVEVVVIAPGDYPTKLQTAIRGNNTDVDIIMGEPKMLEDMYAYGAFADLDALGAGEYEGLITDYVWQFGKDSDGVQRSISYQITPAGLYYRRDIAEEVLGTSDPDEVGKYFNDFSTCLDTAQKMKDAGYRCFASDGEMDYFAKDEPWVVDGKLNLSQGHLDYMDMVVELYKKDLSAYCAKWSTPWFQAMGGPVPLLTADDNVWDENFETATSDSPAVEVFSFALPAWGTIILKEHVGELSGKWGVCAGPNPGFDGGTYLGISELSKKKDMAWDFIKFCAFNEDIIDWWVEESEGDTVSLISAQEKHKDDENPVYGNQKLYAFWTEQAQHIDPSIVTSYDTSMANMWGEAIGKVKNDELDREAAIAEFYDKVASTYPDLIIER